MRLFVAIDLAADAREAVAAVQKRIVLSAGEAGRSLRLVGADQMHLTLAFVGDVNDSAAARIVTAIDGEIDQRSFRLSLAGLGVFPPRDKPRALFLAVGDGAAEVVELQRKVTELLETAGVPREPRPFHPHLTLARWRDGHSADRRVADQDVGLVAGVDVNEAVLYQSRLSSGHPAYTRLAAARLT
jgi:2'-5' RNA ligase